MTWANPSYSYKKRINIAYTKVGGDEVDFPVLVSVTDSNLATTTNGGHVQSSSGYDICFYDSTEKTLLYHEIESYTATGIIIIWVCVTSLSSTSDTIIYMYYGKFGVVTNPSSTSTWNSNYLRVWHMKDATTSTITDSTATGATGTKTAANAPTAAACKIENGQNYDATTEKIYVGNLTSSNNTKMTISIWGNTSDFTTYNEMAISKTSHSTDVTPPYYEYGLYFAKTTKLASGWYNVGGTLYGAASTKNCIDGNWHLAVLTFDGTHVICYADGGNSGEIDAAGTLTNYATNACIGNYTWAAIYQNFIGKLDEARWISACLSVNWILTEYNSQNSPSTFMSFSRELRRTTKILHLGNKQHILNRMDLT